MTSESNATGAARVRQSLDQTMLDAVVPGTFVVGLLYGILAPIYALNPPPRSGDLLVGAAIVTALGLIALRVHWRRHLPDPRHAQILGALVLGTVLANNTLFLALFPEPRYAGTLCAVLLAAGWFFLVQPWFMIFVVATTGAFAFAIFRSTTDAWFAPFMLLFATGGLAAIVRISRARTIERRELTRIEQEAAAVEQRRIEDSVHRAQKLKSLELMAGGIAHDFNNLLAVMIGNANMVLGELPAESGPAERLRDVLAAGSRATDLTSQLLAYTGRGVRQRQSLDLSAHAAEVMQQLERSLPATAQLHCDLDAGLPAIDADAGQLQQVVTNLVLNAAEALEGRTGVITMRTGTRRLQTDDILALQPTAELEPGQLVFLEVEDNGCGMDAQTLEHIFDPFFTTRHSGHGLGLAAVLGIVRGHGGGLRVTSQPGTGTCFSVFLPTSKAAPDRGEAQEPAAMPANNRDRTALVVDDEPLVRHMAAALLKSLGWQVIEAASGVESIEALRTSASNVRFCLLDMTMPGLGGEETLQELRALRPELPVMLTSGYSRESVARAMQAEHTVFLAKPYRIDDFTARLGELLGADAAATDQPPDTDPSGAVSR